MKLASIGEKNLDTFEGTKKQRMVVLDVLNIGPLELHKHIAFICDCEHRTIQTGQDIIAVIGEDVLGQQPFTVNFRDCTLTLHDKSTFVPPASEAFPLRSTADTPEVRASIEGREGWFAIDSGYSDPIILTRPFADLNSDLIQSRPQLRSQALWSENQESYGLYFASADILGKHFRNCLEATMAAIDSGGERVV